MPFRIAVIPGDGIGPEVIAQGIRVLQVVTAATGTELDFVSYDLGADRYLRTGEILPDSVFRELEQVDGIDLGVVRDNTEGAYVGIGGQFKRGTPDEIAIQEDVNTRKGVERIVRYAFG